MLSVTQGLFLQRSTATARIKQGSSKEQQLNYQASGSFIICEGSSILMLICSSPVRCIKKEKRVKANKKTPKFRYTEGKIFILVQIKLRLPSACLTLWLCCPCSGVAEVVSTAFPALMAGLIHYLVVIS